MNKNEIEKFAETIGKTHVSTDEEVERIYNALSRPRSHSSLGAAMHRALLILKNREGYNYWKAKKNGRKFRELNRGAGYYLTIGLFGHNPIGQKWEAEMESGKIGLYELVDYDTYRDPKDMVKNSWWNFLGYKESKLIRDCSFEEFISLYAS